MKCETTIRNGKRFALVPLDDYRRLTSLDGLPPLPRVDADGTCNAIEFMRVSIARTLIRDRRNDIGAEGAAQALASLERPDDGALLGGWIARFIRR